MMSSTPETDPILDAPTAVLGEPAVVGAPPLRRPPPARCSLERVGFVWSSLCAVHCTVPLVATGLALATGAHLHDHEHAHRHHDALQLSLAIATVTIAGLLLVRSYVSQHGNWRPLALLGVGGAALGLGHVFPWATASTALVVTTAGFLTILIAQLANMALLRRSARCCGRTTRCCATPSPN